MTLILVLLVAGIVLAVLIFYGVIPVGSWRVSLVVTFKLTDIDFKESLANVPVRLLFSCDQGWQEPNTGQHFVTDVHGEGRMTASVVFVRRWRKMPNYLINRLLSLPQLTDRIVVGAEMTYMNLPCLYVVDISLFPNGTTLQDNFSVYIQDAKGRFTVRAEGTDARGWQIPLPGGMMLSRPGYELVSRMLGHDEAGENWTLNLIFKKHPDAVQR